MTQALDEVGRPLAEVLDQIELVADGELGVLVAKRVDLVLDGLDVHLKQAAGARQDLAAVDLLDGIPESGSVLLEADALNGTNAHIPFPPLKYWCSRPCNPRPKTKIALINSVFILAQSRKIVKEEYREMCISPYFVVNMHNMGKN